MRTVNVRVADLPRIVLPIGYVGENLRMQVRFDCLEVFDEYPTAVPALTVSPPYGEPYPAVATREGNFFVWNIQDSDLVEEGDGEFQITFTVDEVVVKTYVSKTKIFRSIFPTGEIPDPIANWLDQANTALNNIPQTIINALQEAKDSGEFDGFSPTVAVTEIPGGHEVTFTDIDGDHSFTILDGEKGDPGFSPSATVSKTGKASVITITDESGTTEVTVMDGADANPEDLIDDTAGVGVRNRVWSANRVVTEFNQVAANYVPMSKVGANNGVAELDQNGKILSSELPSYVDDVVDGYYYNNRFYEDPTHTIEILGESGKVYVDLSTNKTYRWSGSVFVVIASDLALGETSTTAYRGDRGAAAYAAAVTNVEVVPTENSENLITSGGVYSSVEDKADKTDTVLNTTLSIGRKANTAVGDNSVATGYDVIASGAQSHAEGSYAYATGAQAHAEGANTLASGAQSHAEGDDTQARGHAAHAEGGSTRATNTYAHAEGNSTRATGLHAHAEGTYTYASGANSHAEGLGYSNSSTVYGALGKADHSEGYNTIANSGTTATYYGAHAEGKTTEASSCGAHAEGNSTIANAFAAHAEGNSTSVTGAYGHAEGNTTSASGQAAHAEGFGTVADGEYQHAGGKYNTVDTNNVYAEMIGNGTDDSTRSNARVLTWTGDERIAGDVYVGCNADSTGGTKLAKTTDIPDFSSKIDTSEKGSANGVATLDQNGKIPSGQLPQIGPSLPSGGVTGDLLAKRSSGDGDAEWITPADSAEQDNTRPITAAAVYTQIGNINALLATI